MRCWILIVTVSRLIPPTSQGLTYFPWPRRCQELMGFNCFRFFLSGLNSSFCLGVLSNIKSQENIARINVVSIFFLPIQWGSKYNDCILSWWWGSSSGYYLVSVKYPFIEMVDSHVPFIGKIYLLKIFIFDRIACKITLKKNNRKDSICEPYF